MDAQDFLLQTENSLPTIDSMGVPSTPKPGVAGISMGNGELPTVTASPLTYFKFGASGVVGLLGMYYLGAGKKQSDFGKMMIGAGLTLASFFLF